MTTDKKTLRKTTNPNRGHLHLTWGRFEAMLRACGYLLDGHFIETIDLTDEGFTCTTGKTKEAR